MALTVQWVDGAEHGRDMSTTANANAAIAGTITNPGANPGTGVVADGEYGSYAYECLWTSGGGAGINRAVSGLPNKVCQFFRFKVITNPATNAQHIGGGWSTTTAGGTNAVKLGLNTNGTIRLRPNGASATGEQTGPNVNDGAWHSVEVQADYSANPWTVDWWVDGVKQTQATRAVAADTVTNVILGAASTPTESYAVRYDDWVYGTWTSSSDTIGDVKVLAISPGSDGTHNTGGTVFVPSDTANIPLFTNASTDAWTFVDDWPLTLTRSTSDLIACKAHVAGEYLEIANVAADSSEPDAIGVSAWMVYSSQSTNANSGATTVVRTSAGTDIVLFGDPAGVGADFSETTNWLKSVMVDKPAGGWTNTELDAIRYRMGRGSGSDFAPRPTWQGFVTQVAYPIVSAVDLGAISVTGTGAIALGNILSTANFGALALTGAGAIALGQLLTTAQLGALGLTGTGAITLGELVTAVQLGAIALSGAGTIALGQLLTEAILGQIALAGTGTLTIADLTIDTAAVDLGAISVTGTGAIAVQGLTPQAVLGQITVTGADVLTVGELVRTAKLGALSVLGDGTITVGHIDTALVVQLGAISIDGDGQINVEVPISEIIMALSVHGSGRINIDSPRRVTRKRSFDPTFTRVKL